MTLLMVAFCMKQLLNVEFLTDVDAAPETATAPPRTNNGWEAGSFGSASEEAAGGDGNVSQS
jgi:hypothetical protein